MKRFWFVLALFATSCVMQPAYAGPACPTEPEPVETLRLQRDCPTPWAGWLYTPAAHQGVATDFARLDAIVDALKSAHDDCARRRTAERLDCAAELGDSSARLRDLAGRVEHPPPRATPWAWMGASVAAAAVPYTVARLLGFGELPSAASAAVGLGVVAGVGVAW